MPDVTVDVEPMAGWAPMEKLERSGRLADHVIALAARLGFETKDVSTGGASRREHDVRDGRPLDRRPRARSAGCDHSPDEYLEVDSIVPRTTLVAALLLAIGRDPEVAAWRQG